MSRLWPGWLEPRGDLKLEDDSSSRFLPWLVAPMLFLCALALMVAFVLSGMTGRWERDLRGTITIEIPVAPGPAAQSGPQTRQRADMITRLLEDLPGITQIRPVEEQQVARLLAPWLGDAVSVQDLPLPVLLDVTLSGDPPVDLQALSRQLIQRLPGTVLDDHRQWMGRLLRLGRTITALALVSVALILALSALTVIFATRSSLDAHRSDIEMLHMIGAEDSYIARQFAARMGVLALRGGLAGLLPALPVLLALLWGEKDGSTGLFIGTLVVPGWTWLVLLLLPGISALVAAGAARLTVHRVLRGFY